MLMVPQHWALYFDETGFRLEPHSNGTRAPAKNRIIEEGLETILFHWGNELLPSPRLHMLGCSSPIVPEQDLLGVDELGRIHIFELKKDSARAESMFQLISYLMGRPQDDAQWLKRTIVDTLWYGEQNTACRLAGLVARKQVKTLSTEKSRGTYGERLENKLEKLTQLASQRTGLDLTPDLFRKIAEPLLNKEFGGPWRAPLEDPTHVLDRFAGRKLPSHWKVGRTKPHIIIWMVAPRIRGALEAVQPLINRGLEMRCVSVDAREVIPGREWSITVMVDAPEDYACNWLIADRFSHLLRLVLDRHWEQCPRAADRVSLTFRTGSDETADLQWRDVGRESVRLIFSVGQDRIECYPKDEWWTEGRALGIRDEVHKVTRRMRKRPRSWPWSPQDPEGAYNREFVEGAARLASDYLRDLEEIGAFRVNDWGFWMPPK